MTNAFGLSPVVVATWMAAAVGVVLAGLLILAGFNRMLLRMALRNTVRRRGQTVLIIVGLMLATVIFTASLGVGDTLTYSVQADQLRQIGGIDEAFTRHGATGAFDDPGYPIAGSGDSDFFTDAQATDVIARSLSDPNVAAAAALVAVPGSVVDKTTSQTASMSVTVFGVADDFGRVWGTLRSRSGAIVQVSELGPDEVYIGRALANRLDARSGDKLNVYVDGQLTEVRVRQVFDTDINRPVPFWLAPVAYVFPSAAGSSVMMPIASVRAAINRPKGYNLILLHNRGSGGLDDLGPGGATGREIARRVHAAFTDRQAAAEMKAYLNTPAMRARLRTVADQAVMFPATRDAARALLVALDRPQVDDDFIALVADEWGQGAIREAAPSLNNLPMGSPEQRAAEQDFEDLFTSLRVDSGAAAEMKALLDSSEIRNPLTQLAAGLPPSDPAFTTINSLLLEARRADVTRRFKAMVGDPNVQRELGMTIGKIAPAQRELFTEIASRLDLYVFATYKADALANGRVIGFFASSTLLSVSLFAMAVGGLLIFLIFVMLAAERRAEMGMSRALGLRRRDLIQCFLFEGTAYTLVASGVGVVVGVLVGWLMTFVISSLFSTLSTSLALQYQVDWTSLAMAVCLGILLTFAIVAFSAYKVSRLNIVAAIRDLDENEGRDASLSRMFTSVFRTAWFGVRQLLQGHPLVFLNRITLGTLGGVRTFWWALFRRGPLTILLGTILVAFAVGHQPVADIDGGIRTNLNSPVIYKAGVSLVIFGAGLLIKWLFTLGGMRRLSAARVGFTVAALGLLVYWGRPFGQVEELLHIQDALQVSKLAGGADLVVFSAPMLLLGAILVVIYNIEVLIGVVTSVTGRIGSLAPVTRTSMAYPMASKFRTGMAIALFALVTFTVVFMSIFKDSLTQNMAINDGSAGGWQIVAGSTDFGLFRGSTTQLPTDIAALVRADSALSSEVRAAGWENISVNFQTARADGTTSYDNLRVVDDVYLSNTGFAVKARAAGYASDHAAWEAVRDNVGFAIISSPEDKAAFEPYDLQLFRTDDHGNPTKESMTVTVIGYATTGLWGGVYVSTRTALAGGFFAQSSAESAPPSLATSQLPLTPTGYYFMLQPGVDAQKARRDVGRLLVNYQLEPITVAELVNQPVRASAAIMSLMIGFLALGLVVGIAGLGVISSRAVVERWQQIGMLRALGYRGSLVQRSFLMESSLIAILGLTIGSAVGVWFSYRYLIADGSANVFGGKPTFHVPIVEIAGILVLAYLATLLTTYLPARAAARIAPAEALRYE
jgi:putative ABC transport system permease protein